MPEEFIKPFAQLRYLFWYLVALYFIALVLFFGISFTPVVDQTILIGWSAAAAICLYAASVFRHSTFKIQVVFFLLYAAGLTILLMLNDLFRLDDREF
ncbi:MAG: hypothetical protein L0H73_17545, partial [Nitrococcus sp.]|nr:hypothetical protein [Nitrococcus sp.]